MLIYKVRGVKMLKRNELLENLINLRREIRTNHLEKYNEKIIVITDQGLEEIFKKRPLQKSDFLAISGLDNNFLEDYANLFLKVINQHRLKQNKEVKVSKTAYKVLNNYKDRLTNISKSNSNLYLGRIHKIKSFDLTSLSEENNMVDFLTNKKSKQLNLNIEQDFLTNHLTTLYRNINKEYRENGSYNLYIAYPYVESYLRKEKFAIKAPLLYFPVKLERKRKQFYIVKDLDKDILFNRDLVLTAAKFNKINKIEEMPQIDNFNLDILNNVVIPFYNKNGITTNGSIKAFDFKPFKNDLKEDFIKTKYKNYELEQYLVLGRFQVHSFL